VLLTCVPAGGEQPRVASDEFILLLKIGLTGIIDQLNDPYFPQPKNIWIKGGYTATVALKLAYERPEMKTFLDANATCSKASMNPSKRRKTGKGSEDHDDDEPNDEMDKRPLTYFLGPFLNEGMRLINFPQLFSSVNKHLEFKEFYGTFLCDLVLVLQPISGVHGLCRLLAKYDKRYLAQKEKMDVDVERRATQSHDEREKEFQGAIAAETKYFDAKNQLKARKAGQFPGNMEELEAKVEEAKCKYHEHWDMLGGPYSLSPELDLMRIDRELRANPQPRDVDHQRMGPQMVEQYKQMLFSALNGDPWRQVMKPYIHSRDRSLDLMNYQAIITFIIPPAFRTIMERWEEEEEIACRDAVQVRNTAVIRRCCWLISHRNQKMSQKQS
jgi:hypothetical protein